MKQSIVVPIFNEVRRLPASLPQLVSYARAVPGVEILLVDDGSHDGSGELIASYQERHRDLSLRLLRNPRNHGKGYAVRQGMLAAQGEICLFSDADLSTPLEEIGRLLPELADNDVVIGSRAIKDARILQSQSLYRTLGGKGLNLFIQWLALPGIRDSQCGFKLFRRQAAQAIFERVTLHGFSFDVELLFIARHLGYRTREMPISWKDVEGSKVQPIRDALRLLRDLLIIRRQGLRGDYD